MKILFLSQRVPYPPNRGDKITTWRLVERLGRAHEVRIVAFAHDDSDERAADALRTKGFHVRTFRHNDKLARLLSAPLLMTRTPLTLGVYGSKALQAAVDEEIEGCGLAYAYSSSMGAFLEHHPHVPRVMHFGELDSDKWRQYAERTAPPMSWVYAREHKTLLEFERRIAASFFANVVCTPLERTIFERQIPGSSALVLRNGVDLEQFSPGGAAPEPGHVVFTGVMNYFPNADGCVWFAREILPRVRERVPAATFSIVGSHPTDEVKALASIPGVTVTGFVDDTSDWLRRAAVSVAPLRIARGIQNKVLEAMACGLPVVGTTCATQGVEGLDGRDFVVRDDATGFGDAVVELLSSDVRARELGAAARRFVEDRYDWEVVFQPLDELVARAERASRRGLAPTR